MKLCKICTPIRKCLVAPDRLLLWTQGYSSLMLKILHESFAHWLKQVSNAGRLLRLLLQISHNERGWLCFVIQGVCVCVCSVYTVRVLKMQSLLSDIQWSRFKCKNIWSCAHTQTLWFTFMTSWCFFSFFAFFCCFFFLQEFSFSLQPSDSESRVTCYWME